MVLKEAVEFNYSYKKVGKPTLVKLKKCAYKDLFKKAGPHPTGNKTIFSNIKVIYRIVIFMALCQTQCLTEITSSDVQMSRCAPRPPSRPAPAVCSTSPVTLTLSWAHWSKSTNKLNRIINGNGRKGYNIGLWNCRRGLIDREKCASIKMVEVKQFLERKNLHILCLVESDLHSHISRYIRRHPLNNEEIQNILGVPGYKIILPKSWQLHGQARILIFAKEELQVKIRNLGVEDSDLPTISCEIGLGREKKSIVNFFYREFTGGVSGLNDTPSQVERFSRQIKIWKALCSGTKDVVCLGDTNICALKWFEDSYQHTELSDMVQNFMLESVCPHLVKEYMR